MHHEGLMDGRTVSDVQLNMRGESGCHVCEQRALKSQFHTRRYVFVEYGPMELDLNLRVRIDELERYLADKVRPS